MPDYRVRDPQSGRTITLRGNGPAPTESELERIFASLGPAPAPPTPMASHEPRSRMDRLGDSLEGVAHGVEDMVLGGLLRSAPANVVYQGGDMLRRGWNAVAPASMEVGRPVTDPGVQRVMSPPDNAYGKAGRFVGDAAMFAVPLSKMSRAVAGAGILTRAAAEGAAGAGVAAAQTGGDPEAMSLGAVGGAALPVVARGVGSGLTAVRRAAAGAQEGGVPGALAAMVRSTAPLAPRAMLVQALKPRSTQTRFTSSLDLAMPELKATEGHLGKPIANLDDLLEASKQAKRRLRGQYDSMAGPMRAGGWEVDLSSVADAMERSIPRKLQIENPAAAMRLQQAAQVYRQRFGLEDAEQILKETNAELDAFYNKYPAGQRRAVTADPQAAALDAQGRALRTAIYSRLDEEGGGEAARVLQRRYGALLEVEEEATRRVNVSRRQQPESLSEQMSAWRAAGDYARGAWRIAHGDLTGAADIASAKAMRSTATYIKEQQTSDALVRRAFEVYRQLPEPVQMPARRPVRGLLERGPIVTPPAADPSFVRSVPAMPSHSSRPALPPGRTPIAAPSVPDPSFVRGVDASADVQRRPVRGLLPSAQPSAPTQGPRRVFQMPGEVRPDPSGGRTIPAAPIDYAVNPTVAVKAGGFRVKQFSSDPEAAKAAVASPDVRKMLQQMLDDLDTFEPLRGKLVKDSYDTTEAHYVNATAGSPVADDVRVISEQNVSNRKVRAAVSELLAGKTPTNRLHTAALDAAMGYLERRPGYRGPVRPSGWGSEDDGFAAFSRAVDELADE